MPAPLSAPAASEDLMLGVTSTPFDDIHVGDDDTNDKTDTFDTKPSSA